jgi:hypothetical protein
MTVIQKFTRFSANYPSLFCLEIWKESAHMANHLNGKFNDCYLTHGAMGAMTAFYMGLDQENAIIFEKYLINEYNG